MKLSKSMSVVLFLISRMYFWNCEETHFRSHWQLCSDKDAVEIQVQIPLPPPLRSKYNFKKLWVWVKSWEWMAVDVPACWLARTLRLINSLTGQPWAPTERSPGHSSRTGEVAASSANNLRPMVFVCAHQVNCCLTELQPLSFSLCQEPLERLYEDN